MSDPVSVRCSRVTRRFTDGDRSIVALDDFSVELAGGTSVAVTGPSGSGKSTLLGLLAALDYADEGTIHVDAVELGGLSTVEQAEFRARAVSYLYPEYNLLPMLTVYENIALALSLQRLPEPEIDRRIRESLDRVGIAELAYRNPLALSSGQRARAALARAIAAGSRLLIADEPTAHLDARNASLVADLLATIGHDPDRLVVFATHDPDVAAAADTVIELRAHGA